MPTAKVKIDGKWYEIGGNVSLDEKKEINDKIIELETKFTIVQGEISSKVSQAEVDESIGDARDYAKNYADSISSILGQEISNVQGDLDNLELYLDDAFKDGIIYEAEQRNIEAYINTLAESKSVVDARYTQIYNNPLLVDNPEAKPPQTNKANLQSAKASYDAKYTNLIDVINEVISDTRVDDLERDRVDQAYDSYRSSISSLSSSFEKCVDFIAQKKADMAETNAGKYTDGLVGPLAERVSKTESSITQTAKDIELRVSQEDYNNEKMRENWYNFVKQNSPNMIGDIEGQTPSEGYTWALADLPDGTMGRVLRKKHTGGSLINNTPWLMPEIKVDPKKPYLMEFWVKALDVNSEVYYGREEFMELEDGTISDNDQGTGPYMVAASKADANTVRKWVKHYAVIPPHDAGQENDHFTPQSAYTPDMEYKFWNEDSTFIKTKIYLTYGVANISQDSEMHAWGFGLYEIGSQINIYKELEYLNLEMSTSKSTISQNSEQIALRVTTSVYETDMSNITKKLQDLEDSVPYQVVINSTNGNIFYKGDVETILEAVVMDGNEDVTSTIDASNFKWSRSSKDTAGDTLWNNAHATGSKTITVTKDDILQRANFKCAVTIPKE